MTRAEIRERLGIVMLEDPKFANQELTEAEAEDYERMMNAVLSEFEKMGNKKPQDNTDRQRIKKAMNTLDGVIPSPQNRMVDSEHKEIAIAWQEIKKALLIYDYEHDAMVTAKRRRERQVEVIRCKVDAGTLTDTDRRLLDELGIPYHYNRRKKR